MRVLVNFRSKPRFTAGKRRGRRGVLPKIPRQPGGIVKPYYQQPASSCRGEGTKRTKATATATATALANVFPSYRKKTPRRDRPNDYPLSFCLSNAERGSSPQARRGRKLDDEEHETWREFPTFNLSHYCARRRRQPFISTTATSSSSLSLLRSFYRSASISQTTPKELRVANQING